MTEGFAQLIPWVTGGMVILAVLAMLHRPLGYLLRLGVRSSLGMALLACLQPLHPVLGLGVNWLNGLVLGLLGLPGLGLLLLLRWALRE